MRMFFLVALGTLAGYSSVARGQTNMQPILEKVKIEHKLDSQVPLDLPFRNERGEAVTLGEFFHGKPVILVLAYYRCPMLCNQVLNGVVDGLRGISFDAGTDFQVVIVSFDAREQSALAAAKKATYVEHYGRPDAEEGWHFLVGDQPSIDRLTQAVGFPYLYDSARDQFIHDSGIMILTPEGRLSRYLYGIDYPSRDLRLSLVEASARQIASRPCDVALFPLRSCQRKIHCLGSDIGPYCGCDNDSGPEHVFISRLASRAKNAPGEPGCVSAWRRVRGFSVFDFASEVMHVRASPALSRASLHDC
jgi:cytochrome oxidase Cu insertion factor (SCO1/SenC/PrrC family)